MPNPTLFRWATMGMLFLSAFGSIPVGVAEEKQAQDEAGTEERRTPNPALEAAIKKLKLPGVSINLAERHIDIEAKICLDKGLLELVACTKGTKEHESIVVTEARPMHIHTALLLLGANPGNPAMRRPVNEEKTNFIDVPPQGDAVEVFLVIEAGEGKPIERPISNFISRTQADAETPVATTTAAATKQAFPRTFLFAGSHLLEKGTGPREYLADGSGNLISIVTFGDELLGLPDVHSIANSALEWQVNAKELPAVGTKVILRLRPQRKPAAVGSAATRLPIKPTSEK